MRKTKGTIEVVDINEVKCQNLAANKEDPFNRLPDDLLLVILSRLVDIKYLCQCSLVSKRFAFVISQTQNVSIVIPSSEEPAYDSCMIISKLLRKLGQHQTFEGSPEFMLPYLEKLKFPMFFDKFRGLKTIHLECRDPINNVISSFPKWKVKCNNSPMIESLVSLLPAKIHKATDKPSLEQVKPDYVKTHPNVTHLIDGFLLPVMPSLEWMCLIYMLVKVDASLKMVTIVDDQRRCNFVLHEEQLVKLRSHVLGENPIGCLLNNTVHCAWIPKLHLPLSGHIMTGVLFLIANFPSESDPSASQENMYNEVMSWDYGDDEMILVEAIKEIFKNHKHEIKAPVTVSKRVFYCYE